MRAGSVAVALALALVASCVAPDDGCPDGTRIAAHGSCAPATCDGNADCGGLSNWIDAPGVGCEEEEVCLHASLEGDELAQTPVRVESCPAALEPMETCQCDRVGICRDSIVRAVVVRGLECGLVLLCGGALVLAFRRRGERQS